MKEVKEAVVKSRLQAEGADDAGDAQQILADGHSRQTDGNPQESPGAGAAGAQCARQNPPLVPEHEAALLAGRLEVRVIGVDHSPSQYSIYMLY